jgi:hypothetical protein
MIYDVTVKKDKDMNTNTITNASANMKDALRSAAQAQYVDPHGFEKAQHFASRTVWSSHSVRCLIGQKSAQRYEKYVPVPTGLMPLARFLHLHVLMSGTPRKSPIACCIAALVRRTRGGFLVRRDALQQLLDGMALTAQKGGAHLGAGRDGTVVYTLDEVASRYPQAGVTCMHTFPGGATCYKKRVTIAETCNDMGVDPRDLAVKDIDDDEEARFEASLHTVVHRMFASTRPKKSSLCTLHGTINCIDVSAAGRSRRLLVMRRLAGDVTRLHPTVLKSPRAIKNLLVDVLGALAVFHRKRLAHMDVKPQNIMWYYTPQGLRFVLGDYGLLTPGHAVLQHLKDGGRPVGTPGYISPILYSGNLDEDGESAYARLAWLPAPGGQTLEQCIEGDRARAIARGGDLLACKADLHSLALTIVDLLDGPAGAETLRGFLSGLLFSRPSDFKTAVQALHAAQQL